LDFLPDCLFTQVEPSALLQLLLFVPGRTAGQYLDSPVVRFALRGLERAGLAFPPESMGQIGDGK